MGKWGRSIAAGASGFVAAIILFGCSGQFLLTRFGAPLQMARDISNVLALLAAVAVGGFAFWINYWEPPSWPRDPVDAP